MSHKLQTCHLGTLLLAAALALTACGGNDDSASAPPAATIGIAGGTVTGPNGAQVVVPAGALAADTAITVAQSSAGSPALPANLTTFGATYAFTPHGTTFAVPATITVPFDAAAVPAGRTPALFKTNAAGAWVQVAGATVNAATISAPVTGFSWTVVGATLASGGTWQQLGGTLDVAPAFNAIANSVVLDAGGNPVVAWVETGTALGVTSKAIYVKRWDGASWVQLGGNLSHLPMPTQAFLDTPSIDIDRTTGQPVVAWSEERPASGSVCLFNSDVYVKRWDGSAWQQLGAALNVDPAGCGVHPKVRVTASGTPVVAWWESPNNVAAKSWNGSAWVGFNGQNFITSVPTGSQDAASTSLAIDSTSGDAIVAFGASGGPLVARGSAAGWTLLPGSVRVNPDAAESWSAAVDALGRPVVLVATGNSASTTLRVRGFESGAWSDVGAVLSTASRPTLYSGLSLAIPFGTQAPIASWFTGAVAGPTASSVQTFRQWDGSTWSTPFAPDIAQAQCTVAVGATTAAASAAPVVACVRLAAAGNTDVVAYRLAP